MRLPPPDPLSTILLYLAAIIMALREALAPGTPLSKAAPSLTMGSVWPYVPLALVSAAAVVWIVRGLKKSSAPPQMPQHPVVQAAPAPQPSGPRWWEKLEGVQIYFLIYMGLYFTYLTVTSIFGER